jgi:hypothetical protein
VPAAAKKQPTLADYYGVPPPPPTPATGPTPGAVPQPAPLPPAAPPPAGPTPRPGAQAGPGVPELPDYYLGLGQKLDALVEPVLQPLLHTADVPAAFLNEWMRRAHEQDVAREASGMGPAEQLSEAVRDLIRSFPAAAQKGREAISLPPGEHVAPDYLPGQGLPGKVASYAADFFYNPANLLLGPLHAATLGKGIASGARALGRELSPALSTATGQLISRGLYALGTGPTHAMMRQATRAYEQHVALRLQDAGNIARDLARETTALWTRSPGFQKATENWKGEESGPVQALVRDYVVTHFQKHLPTGPIDQALANRARALQVPPQMVKQYGDRLVNHLQETEAELFRGGKTPFVKARGKQWEKSLAPGAAQAQMKIAGVAKAAKAPAEDRLRRRWAREYLNQLFAGEPVDRLGGLGSATFSGAGIRSVRRAGLANLSLSLVRDGRYVRPFAGALPPGWRVVPDVRDFGLLAGKMMPEPLFNYLAREVGRTEKVYTKLGRAAIGASTRAAGNGNAILDAAERLTGLRKKLWIGNFSTAGANILSNQMAVELAARREGFSLAAFTKNLVKSGPEVVTWQKTGRATPTLSRLMQRSRSFVETEAQTAAIAGRKSAKAVAGLSGRIASVAGKRVHVPEAQELAARAGNLLVSMHGTPERAYKLALYRTLEPKVGPERAAELTEKYLFDYSDRGYLLEMLDRYGIWVFNAFPTKATGLLLDTLVHRPDLVARYPRLQEQLLSEAPGAKERYQALPDYRQGPFTVPAGQGRFVDLSRFNPFGQPLKPAQEAGDALLTGRLPASVTETLQTPANLLGNTALSPEFSVGMNRRLYGSEENPIRIAPRGAPLEENLKLRGQDWIYQQLPGFARGLSDWIAASHGEAFRGGRTGEHTTPAQAFLSGFLGIRPFSGEFSQEKRARTDPLNRPERQSAGVFLGQEMRRFMAPTEPNPYRNHYAGIMDRGALEREALAQRQYIGNLLPGPLTGDKQRQITDAAARLQATLTRLRELPRR